MATFDPNALMQDLLQKKINAPRRSNRPEFKGVDFRKEIGPQDRTDISQGNLIGKLAIIDGYAPEFEVDNSYLERAEDIMFRANQLNQQASFLNANRPVDFIGGVQKISPSTIKAVKRMKKNKQPVSLNNMGGGGSFGKFVKAIAGKESGGSYKAVNQDSGALGKYQIMPSNFAGPGGWDKEALGRDISPQQFLNNPAIQDKIATHKLRQYYNQHGVRGAASAWYSGDPNKWRNKSPQGGYPSINAYVMDILRRMGIG